MSSPLEIIDPPTNQSFCSKEKLSIIPDVYHDQTYQGISSQTTIDDVTPSYISKRKNRA